jgi:type VI secretion system protein ImpJ
MRSLSRVVWSEGMHLGPHHFQVQARYFEDATRFATASLWPLSYGLAGCRLDPDALENGAISVLHARGLFPDGLAFDMPDCDALPPTRNLTDLFPPTRDTVTVMLGIPERKAGQRNCNVSEDGVVARFVAASRAVADENTGADERPVRFGRKNVSLVLDTESTEGLNTLPLARVMRDGSGRFVFDPTFIPPCLQIAASESLMLLLRRLVEILEEKSASMSRAPGKSFVEFSSREIASFWFLHAVNSGLAPLRHLWTAKRGHPEELYLQMARLAGALCTFALESDPREIPAYDHDRLDQTFGELDRHIRRHLDIIVPTNCVTIPLSLAARYFYEGDITDQRCLSRSRWILGIRSSAGDVDVMSKTPQIVKVCSALFVPELVRRALPGLALTHLPVPPPAVSAKADCHYFSISKGGPCWDHLLKTHRVGVYVPGDLPDCELELLVVLES